MLCNNIVRFKGERFQVLSLASCLAMEELLKFPNS